MFCYAISTYLKLRRLLDIAEQEGVKDNEEGLKGWTAFQLLHKASEGAAKGFEILTLAVDNIVSSLSSR